MRGTVEQLSKDHKKKVAENAIKVFVINKFL